MKEKKVRPPATKKMKIAGWISIIFLSFIVVKCVTTPVGPLTEEQIFGRADVSCKAYIRETLNDPGSAEFLRERVIQNTDNVYSVVAEVRAKNAFGAYIKRVFTCKLKFDPDRKYFDLLDIK